MFFIGLRVLNLIFCVAHAQLFIMCVVCSNVC